MENPVSPEELSAPVVLSKTPCRHLRNKGMYVYTDGNFDEPKDEENDNSIYVCLSTMKSFGPDDDYVDGRECRNPGRSCFEPI